MQQPIQSKTDDADDDTVMPPAKRDCPRGLLPREQQW